MKYKQRLATDEAIQFTGNIHEIIAWYQKASGKSSLPFYSSGRDFYISDPTVAGDTQLLNKGDYVVLNPDGKTLTVMSAPRFEVTHVIPKEDGSEEKH